jgi:hypothetical protein
VLQHFSTTELLSITETSIDFWEFISTSRKFLKNVYLRINVDGKRISVKEFSFIIENLGRKYENVHFEGSDVVTKIETFARIYRTPIKSLKLSNTIFNRPTLLQSFIEFTRNSVEELIMTSVYIFNCDQKILISIPGLKKLEMENCNDEENDFLKRISFVISEDCENLETLKLKYAGVGEKNQQKLLAVNKKITSLSLSDVDNNFFKNIERTIQFNLKKFKIKFSTYERYKQKPNFDNFLLSQKATLKDVEISGWIRENTLLTVFSLPQLQILRVCGSKNFFARLQPKFLLLNLTENRSLKELLLTDDLMYHQEIWRLFLEKAPNLNRFQLFNTSYYP